MRYLTNKHFVSFIIFFSFLLPNCLGDAPDEDLHLKCLYPTVNIIAKDNSVTGSGVIVKSVKMNENEYFNILLTAAHVVRGYEQYTVNVFEYEDWSNLNKTKSYSLVFYAKDPYRDMAIGAFITSEKMPVASIDMQSKFYIGNEILHVGCGAADAPRIDYGKITSIFKNINDKKFSRFRTSVHTVPGDSGGPLFSNKYKLIGIAESLRVWSNIPLFNVSFYTPITYLRDWSNEENGAFDFVWKESALPKMIFWELRFSRDYGIVISK